MNSYARQQQQQPMSADQMHSFLRDKQAWENAIAMYQGPDPLDHWYNYVCWYENHGHGDPDNKFRETLERCLTLYEHSDCYKQDSRMVRLWLKYIDMQPNPLHFYQVLYQRGVGRQVASFYVSWAGYYESIHALKEAESVFNLGFQEKAQPFEEMHHAHNKFLYTRSQITQQQQQHSGKPMQNLHQQHYQQQQQPQVQQSPHGHAHAHHIQQQQQSPAVAQMLSPQMQNYSPQQQQERSAYHQTPPPQPQMHHVQHLHQQQQQPHSQQQVYQQQQQQHVNYQSQQHQQQSQTQLQQHQSHGQQQQAQHNQQHVHQTHHHHQQQQQQQQQAHVHEAATTTNYVHAQQQQQHNIEQAIPSANAVPAIAQHLPAQNGAPPYTHNHQQQQQQQHTPPQTMQSEHNACTTSMVESIPVEGIKLPRKYATFCHNNNETWTPALFLEEPADPCRNCHYAKQLVYPEGSPIEYSPEELRARKYAARLEELRLRQRAAMEEEEEKTKLEKQQQQQQQQKEQEEQQRQLQQLQQLQQQQQLLQQQQQQIHQQHQRQLQEVGAVAAQHQQQHLHQQQQQASMQQLHAHNQQQQQQPHQQPHQQQQQHSQQVLQYHQLSQQQQHQTQQQPQQHKQQQQPVLQQNTHTQQLYSSSSSYYNAEYQQFAAGASNAVNHQPQQQQQHVEKQYQYVATTATMHETAVINSELINGGAVQEEEEGEQDTYEEEEEGTEEDETDDYNNYHQQQHPEQTTTGIVNTVDDLEDQIEASTIRFSSSTTDSSKNKTIKIKFKKERHSGNNTHNGNNNYSASYTIESIYQNEATGSPIAAGQPPPVRRNGHSFHPYMLGAHTSTPKTAAQANATTTAAAAAAAKSSAAKRNKAKLKRFNAKFQMAVNNCCSSNSSSAENGSGNGAAAATSAATNGSNSQHNISDDNAIQNVNNFNDNANYSFSSAVAFENSNCSITSGVGRLNFRDSVAGGTVANSSTVVADYSTYQENSYFATQHDTEAKERRLQKALETIERHLAKEAIDPFNSELCRAFLTKLDFPGANDAHANYKIIQTPLPKIGNTRALTLPDTGVHYSIDKEVGRGSYGSVYKASDINSGSVVALKFQKPPNTWEIYICDQVLKRLHSADILPGLMNISTAIIAPNASLIATEFSPFGSLLDINNKIRQATTKVMHESLVMHFSAQICNIIHHLHKHKIIHADIKPDNFLLMRIPNTDLQSPSLRLIDFGCAIDMTLFPQEHTKFRKVIQTDGFTCIEMQEGRPWSYETDLFCIAGTIHVMLFGEYMQLVKRAGSWDIKQKLPRYLKKHVWTKFFSEMLNIKKSSKPPPDLHEMRCVFEEEAGNMDSELQSQIRTLSNILYRR